MKAVGYTRCLPIADVQSLVDLDLPDPVPGHRDLLVRVEAVSVDPRDIKSRKTVPGSADRRLSSDTMRPAWWRRSGLV